MAFKNGVNVLTQKDCPHCKTYKSDYKEELEEGKINEVKIDKLKESDEKTWSIIAGLEIEGIPSLVVRKDDDYCSVDLNTHKELKCLNTNNKKKEIEAPIQELDPVNPPSPLDMIYSHINS